MQNPTFQYKSRCVLAVAGFVLAADAPRAQADLQFPDGANSLFAGHSFFAPVANAFDTIANDNGYNSHSMEIVFRSGPLGSPGSLWNDEPTRTEMTNNLSTGDVELFGLTAFGSTGSGFEDYQLWFDTALSYNPDTTFFIGNPWVPGGSRIETETFDQGIEQSGEDTFATVELLREAYPDNDIIYINYGKTASIMKAMFEARQLPDIDALAPDIPSGVQPEDALFADDLLGHGGPMMIELAALSWMEIIYGADTGSLTLTDYESDIGAIVDEVVVFNQQYAVPEPGSLGLLAVGGLMLISRRRT